MPRAFTWKRAIRKILKGSLSISTDSPPFMELSKLKHLLLISISLIIITTVYIAGVPASVYTGDDGETITCCKTLGIQHPPGYPLHTLIGKLFTMLPAGDVSFKVYFFAVILSALNFLLIYLISLRIAAAAGAKDNKYIFAIAASFAYGLGRTIWEQSIIAKGGIYSLNIFFLLVLTLIMLRAWQERASTPKYLYLFSFVFGASLAHHHMSQFLMAPLYLFFLYRTGMLKNLTIKKSIICGLFFTIGLSAYIYLPVRASAAYLNWGSPDTFENFFRMVTRWQYVRSEGTRSLAGSFTQALKFFSSAGIENLYIGSFFCLIGMVVIFRKDRNLFIYLTGIPLFFLFITSFYLNLTQEKLYIMETYITPSYVSISIFAAAGILAMASVFRGFRAAAAGVIACSLFACQAIYFFPRLDKSSYFFSYDYNKNMLDSLETNSVIFTTGDGIVFPTWYFKYAKSYRPDITLVGSAVLPMKWVRDSINRQNPDIHVPHLKTENIGTESTGYIINALIRLNFTKYPFYFSYNKLEDNAMEGGLKIVPRGIIYKALPEQFAYATRQYMAMQDNIWKFYNFRGVFERRSFFTDQFANDLYLRDYSVCLNSAGTFYEENGLYPESLRYFELAHKFFPSDHEYIYNMGNANYNLKDIGKAEELYKECLKLDPKYESAWFNLGVCYYKQGDNAAALEKFRKVLEINPSRADVKPYVDMLEKAVSK
jgi:tetratricopeptide (TPR) repeat protein